MFNKMVTPTGGSGGLRVQIGTFTATTGDNVVPLDFKPSKLFVYKDNIMTSTFTTPSGMFNMVYDENLSTTKQFISYCLSGGWYANAGSYPPSSSGIGIKDVTSSSFTFQNSGSYASSFAGTFYFIAIE